MKRRKFIENIGTISSLMLASPALAIAEEKKQTPLTILSANEIYAGVWKFTIGIPEKITPQSTRNIQPNISSLKNLPKVSACNVPVEGEVNNRGTFIYLPLKQDEYIYGLGLQMQSFQQRGLKKTLRVNADPTLDTGDSHAPVPFFVSTDGYGVFVDTARYATFYLGNKKKKIDNKVDLPKNDENDGWNALNGPYEKLGFGTDSEILIEIPKTKGVDVYVFGGPTLLNAVQRYNLFSGGGVVPPRWGLGFWYRVESNFSQDEVAGMANYFRESKIPCDVIGLEPHWQSHAYSCSYLWGKGFANPAQMLKDLKTKGFRVNLWEHAYVHPSSPIYKKLIPYSGDYIVWEGLVPDFVNKEAREIFGLLHKKEHVDLGVSGYKTDECDNSDYTGNWSFPELTQFPSGADGEQMHSLFGLRYQDSILEVFNEKKEKTYGLVRSSGALAAPYPFVLYSDLYNHKTFIHSIAQSSFSGLLWTPEVRHATSNEDLIRRLQSVIFSPLAMINAWYLKNAPWKQIDRKTNNDGHFADDWQKLENQCKEIIELRMQLIPYLHAAFVKYHQTGIPPFRALIMDYPNDEKLKNLSSQFMVGENLLVAPVTEGEKIKKVYLPEGEWYHFYTNEKYSGKKEYQIEVPLLQIPIFVKAATILPLATPTLHTEEAASLQLNVKIFGNNAKPVTLFEGDNFENNFTDVQLIWNEAKQSVEIKRKAENKNEKQYSLVDWKVII
ncbi:MAG TPA: TIM-barrel domain-containing protein [Chitinophagaceae bacterium]|nr:TIM-barrel domain-containing protein [Chitinophagaceae bacterium]